MRVRTYRSLMLASTTAAMLVSGASRAQTPDTAPVEPLKPGATSSAAIAATPAVVAGEGGDIIVTARKRDETSLSVPVVVSAVGAAELSRRGVSNLDGIARIVPQLIIGPQGGAIQGGNIALRGIAGPDTNPFGDQAVSFNIDGVQVAKATVRRMSDTDIAQVEVLKGPQALFFGKNSPGGIISIRTADPTPAFQAKATVGYEFKGREKRGEGYISGPISDTLGFRLSGFASDLDGYLKNNIPDGTYVKPTSVKRTPKGKDFSVRGTLKWEPTDAFNARLKVNYGQTKTDGPAATQQFISCPFGGMPQSGSIDECKPDGTTMNPGSGPVVGTLNPRFRDGFNYQKQTQMLSGLEMNYSPSDNLTLTSVTGFYKVRLRQAQNYEQDYALALPSTNIYGNREFSQEIRLQSDYDGPLNFVAGGYFSDTKSYVGSNTFLFATEASGLAVLAGQGLDFIPLRTPFQINNYFVRQKGQAYSAFLQMTYKPIEVIEINVGGRYSYEKKSLPLVQTQAFGGPADGSNIFGFRPLDTGDTVTPLVQKDSWTDFSPEVTVSYRPTQQLTLFGSYKHGFLSGGFNSGSGFAGDLSYDPQTIKGFEAGVKALVLDNKLRLNLAAYTYKVSDLQVNIDRNAINTIRNAAVVKVKGVEFDFSYVTPLQGLSLRGSAAYNDAKYSSFPDSPCYPGQTQSLGCIPTASGVGVQDLTGARLPRAPKWSLSGGFNFEMPVAESFKIGFSLDANYSSRIFSDVTNDPGGIQPSYTLVDGTVRFGDVDDRWELAFIGRNLTNKYYFVASSQVPFTGGPGGGVTGVLGDRFATVSRGRELMLRASYKFGQ